MFFFVTPDPPVIFVASTTFSRRLLSFASHEPMIRSVFPSGRARSLGIGYCSAVSIKDTPFSNTARSKNAWHSVSSGELKSQPPQRCVPRPNSETTMSPPPMRL